MKKAIGDMFHKPELSTSGERQGRKWDVSFSFPAEMMGIVHFCFAPDCEEIVSGTKLSWTHRGVFGGMHGPVRCRAQSCSLST